jgi:hypothetical protein
MRRIHTRLFADADALLAGFGHAPSDDCQAVVLFSLGIAPEALVPFAKRAGEAAVLLADCYGIVGFSAETERNQELLEQGRGQEYGGVGGDGGQGVVAVALCGGTRVTTDPSVKVARASAQMLVTTGGSASFVEGATAPYYGGVAKATYRYATAEERFEPVPGFVVSTLAGEDWAVGTTSFTADPTGSVRALLDGAPADVRVQAVALFPCFMRGKNAYGENDVEPDAVSALLPGVPVFGMFCHGELGPRRCLGFSSGADAAADCGQHSMTTIVAVHVST